MAQPEYGHQIPVRIERLTKENTGLGWYFFCGNEVIVPVKAHCIGQVELKF